jgi:hypothetical protein
MLIRDNVPQYNCTVLKYVEWFLVDSNIRSKSGYKASVSLPYYQLSKLCCAILAWKKITLWFRMRLPNIVGLISILRVGLKPSPRQPPLSALIGGVTTRSVGSGPLLPCI